MTLIDPLTTIIMVTPILLILALAGPLWMVVQRMNRDEEDAQGESQTTCILRLLHPEPKFQPVSYEPLEGGQKLTQ